MPERDELGARIEARFDGMVRAGALEEVRALLSLGLSPELPIMRALGVASLAGHVTGNRSLEEAVAEAKAETRRYAKRQRTWLRRKMIAWIPIFEQEKERLLDGDLSFIDP
jgi:tRNA dimethylallyltransferase